MEIDNKLLLENSRDLKVLYVEDDDSLRESTFKLLSNFFTDLDIVADGKLGYDAYKTKLETTGSPYDIIISDINMPNMNGIEMCEAIKEITPDQAIIFITAFNEVEYLNSAIRLGTHGFLTKPIEMQNLKSVLYTVTQMVADRKLVENHYEQIEDLNMLHIDKKDARNFSCAKDILKDLEINKEKISHIWTGKQVVQERLESHLIDVEFFRTHYAMKVIEYFIGVISGDNKIGNCPVVFIMLDFFKNKDIPLKDIFMICVLFKNTISSYIFERYSFNQLLFDDISLILDKNFEGVIINYLELNYTMIIHKPPVIKKQNVKVDETPQVKVDEVINYMEYVLEHDMYELQDLEEDIDALAIAVSEGSNMNVEDFDILGNQIKRYGNILNNYPIFAELGQYVIKLGVNFSQNAQLLFEDKERMLNIAALIEGFVNDLIIWRREIFENNIEDPHFLDQSFFSNVDTIIMFIEYDESAVNEEEDFDDMFF